jgi:3-isopropylmalate dehydrogenase
VIREAVRVVERAAAITGASILFRHFDWSAEKYLQTGETLPKDALAFLPAEFDAILLGAMGDPRVKDNKHAVDILLGLRFGLDLYVNQRPVRLIDERLSPLKGATPSDVDCVFFRENTEGPYVMMGGNFKRGTPDEVATDTDLNTRKGVERIIRHAFEFAARNGRKRVTMSDKSNVLIHAHDLWQRVFAEVKVEYPQVTSNHLYIDNLCLQLVRDPKQFDVVVTSNMFGDIATDLAAALQGGLGMAASGNIHPGRIGLFEPVHGSAPPFAGKNIANPIGSIATAALMLETCGWSEAANLIDAAIAHAVRALETTVDIGGTLGTREAGEAVLKRLGP